MSSACRICTQNANALKQGLETCSFLVSSGHQLCCLHSIKLFKTEKLLIWGPWFESASGPQWIMSEDVLSCTRLWYHHHNHYELIGFWSYLHCFGRHVSLLSTSVYIVVVFAKNTVRQVPHPRSIPIFKGKATPLQTRTGPEGSRRLRLPDFKTISTWKR
jgi:hypothetical protein